MNIEDLMNEEIEDRRNAPVDFKITCPNNDIVTFKGRPCELSSFSHVPQTRRFQSAERSIYNSKRNSQIPDASVKVTDYDRLFNVSTGACIFSLLGNQCLVNPYYLNRTSVNQIKISNIFH